MIDCLHDNEWNVARDRLSRRFSPAKRSRQSPLGSDPPQGDLQPQGHLHLVPTARCSLNQGSISDKGRSANEPMRLRVRSLRSATAGASRPPCAPAHCRTLRTLTDLERKENVVFLGSPRVGKPGRYNRIAHDPEALQALRTELFVES